ncbi:MAG: glutamate synthase subunit alpha, partial [Chloroflexi bacterium]
GSNAGDHPGDGAGMLTQIPHRLLSAEITDLPKPGDYAVGMLFLPQNNYQAAIDLTEKIVAAVLTRHIKTSDTTAQSSAVKNNIPNTFIVHHSPFATRSHLFWRKVPVNPNSLGRLARRTCSEIRQAIIRRPGHVPPGEPFERFLLTVRKALVAAARRLGIAEFSVPSLSARTVVYKGLMPAPLLADFYPDLRNPLYESALAVVHTRNSPNFAASWHRVQPLRMLAHTGQISTLLGNQNRLKARASTLHSPYWAGGLGELQPLLEPPGSDSSHLDNLLELLVRSGRDIHHGIAMLMPEAWESMADIHPHRHAFYRYHAALLEPWEGPAAVIFTDGRRVGAALDRNGLRPLRYLTTRTNLVVAASEAGVVNLDEGLIVTRGRLGPGQMILVDGVRQLFLTDDPVKNELARRPQYQEWANHFKTFSTETRPADFRRRSQFYYQPPPKVNSTPQWLARFQAAFGYTREEIETILQPMAAQGKEPTGSMGDDTPPAALSKQPRPLFHYFKQQFVQVAGPPIDPLHETFVMSLTTRLGARANLLAESARHAYLIELPSPVLADLDLENLKGLGDPRFQIATIAARYPVARQVGGLRRALNRLCAVAERAVDEGKTILILSDHGVDEQHAPVPNLLAVAAVHHHLVRQGKRAQASLVVESGEVREAHHLACLLGLGANAVNPYLALATVEFPEASGKIKLDLTTARRNFIRALEAGLLKIMSKMGISTVESYTGAQLFEAIGLRRTLVDEYFPGTQLWPGGVGLAHIAAQMARWHRAAFANPKKPALGNPGFYQFNPTGERHAFAPPAVAALHAAVRLPGVLSPQASQPAVWPPEQVRSFIGPNFEAGVAAYQKFVGLLKQNDVINPRDLLKFQPDRAPIDVTDVEPPEAIFGRMSTAGMSHGALSREAHQTLAVAMNRLGARSNSGEGGSAQGRFATERNDRIKQVASGRFGVTPVYLMSADELQIKMAQGAKPGEGGLLPGPKVSAEIAAIRHTRAGTALVSPPAHADVHSADDLAQLIFDLKQVN